MEIDIWTYAHIGALRKENKELKNKIQELENKIQMLENDLFKVL